MPAYNEIADIDVINGNMDKIDVQMKKNADSAQQSKDIVSDEYSATNMYAVGDYCIHENVLYKCKTAITTGEAFDSSKWVQTTCGTEFGELNSNLDTLEFGEVSGGKNLIDVKKVIIGEMTNGEVMSGNNYITDFIHLEYGKNYILSNCYKLAHETAWFTQDKKFIQRTFGTTVTPPTNDCYYARIEYGVEQGIDAQLEEGTQATDYEPYIPSVKMLAEENEQQSIEMLDAKMLGWSVPRDCPIQNTVSGNTFTQRVGRVDLGSLNWVLHSGNVFKVNNFENGAESPTENNIKANIYCSKYKTDYWYYGGEGVISKDNEIALNQNILYVHDSAFTDATSLKNELKGTYLYFKLSTPITMTIDGNEAVTKLKNDLGGLSLSASGTTLTITDGTNTWTLEAN